MKLVQHPNQKKKKKEKSTSTHFEVEFSLLSQLLALPLSIPGYQSLLKGQMPTLKSRQGLSFREQVIGQHGVCFKPHIE